MKTIRLFVLLTLAITFAGNVSAQTADEILGKYLEAIGGKEKLSKITSVYTESTLDVMGMQGTIKTTNLNGKGMRQDMDVAGNNIVSCYTDKAGWSINPMAGSSTAEDMPEAQYNSGKDQVFIGGPFINWAEKGYKAELIGSDSVANISAFKIKMTQPDNTSAVYYFDNHTYYLVRSVQQADMQGQLVDNIITYSDYKEADGYTMPYKMDMDIAGGQFTMSMSVTKVELNKPVDEKIFSKPQ
jgi:hypothetical protein